MTYEHTCIICNKNYASKQSLWNHNHKFHNNIISQKSAKNQPKIQPTSVKNQPIVIQSVVYTKHSIL